MKFVKKNETTHRDILLFSQLTAITKYSKASQPTLRIYDLGPSIFLIQLKTSQRFLVAIAHVEKLFTGMRKEMDGIFGGNNYTLIL